MELALKLKVERGLALKLERVRQGLHLYDVAQQAGISSARLSQYEGGHRQIPSDIEDKLRTLLGMEPSPQLPEGYIKLIEKMRKIDCGEESAYVCSRCGGKCRKWVRKKSGEPYFVCELCTSSYRESHFKGGDAHDPRTI